MKKCCKCRKELISDVVCRVCGHAAILCERCLKPASVPVVKSLRVGNVVAGTTVAGGMR